MRQRLFLTLVLILAMAWPAAGGPRRSFETAKMIRIPIVAATTITSPVTFTSTPNGTVATQAVTFLDTTAARKKSWTVKVAASAANYSGAQCPTNTVPASSTTITCNSVTQGTGSCSSGSQPLSTTPYTIATGSYTGRQNVQVNMTLTFNDSWNYSATAGTGCSLNIQYTVTYN